MNIDRAQCLKPGDRVRVPADYGAPGYYGRVEHVGAVVAFNIHGADYVWVTVRKPGAHASVWPSNRLG